MMMVACFLAGIYGALHNQVSYTIGPDYFHHLKFAQFGIPDEMSPRLGAAQVGFLASWWMGLIIGLPLATLAMLIKGPDRALLRPFLVSAVLVIGITAGFGLMSLGLPIPPSAAELLAVPDTVTDPDGFRRAALLHNTSYLSGLLGLLGGVMFMGLMVWKSRKAT